MLNWKKNLSQLGVVFASTLQATCPYGLWESPISPEKVAASASHVVAFQIDGPYSYLLEIRPENKGRYTIVRLDESGHKEDMTPPDFNVRTFVHEYGGGAFTVSNGTIYASRADDGALYIIRPQETPKRLTKVDNLRFANMKVSPYGIVSVVEEHLQNGPVENYLALINLEDGSVQKLTSGQDFYSSPAISPDGKKIAWISWVHPNMPWTNNELWIAELEKNETQVSLKDPQRISGEEESTFQPQFSNDGTLYFVSDRKSGFWNIHRYLDGQIKNVLPMAAETAQPMWVFDLSTYAFMGNNIVFSYNQMGKWHLGILDLTSKTWKEIPTVASQIDQIRSDANFVRFLEQYPNKGQSLIQLNNTQNFSTKILYSEPKLVEDGYISIPQHISFPSNGRIAYAFYYPPKNVNYQASTEEKPPLIVVMHGGPTAQAFGSFTLGKAFWTSRGFAVLDVNYGGSTGYGRKYRNLLNNQWGVVDVEDAVNGALFLANQGLVDKNKLAIRGGSAGGYTTLAALTFHDIFKAGASYYGISDITALQQDTHKFESHYSENLVGKYPEEKKVWEERSPINSVDRIKAPLILFQGENDKVVPKNQSIRIYEALKNRNVPVELYIYPDEEHGFRKAETIIDALKREEAFYIKVFNIQGNCQSQNLLHK